MLTHVLVFSFILSHTVTQIFQLAETFDLLIAYSEICLVEAETELEELSFGNLPTHTLSYVKKIIRKTGNILRLFEDI